MGQTQSSTFILKNDSSSEIPLTFTKDLLNHLQGNNSKSTSKVEEQPKPKSNIRKLVFEQKSTGDLSNEIVELLNRQESLPSPSPHPALKALDEKIIECYSKQKSLDCYKLVDNLHDFEKSLYAS